MNTRWHPGPSCARSDYSRKQFRSVLSEQYSLLNTPYTKGDRLGWTSGAMLKLTTSWKTHARIRANSLTVVLLMQRLFQLQSTHRSAKTRIAEIRGLPSVMQKCHRRRGTVNEKAGRFHMLDSQQDELHEDETPSASRLPPPGADR